MAARFALAVTMFAAAFGAMGGSRPSKCYTVTVYVPPYHPGATVCFPPPTPSDAV